MTTESVELRVDRIQTILTLSAVEEVRLRSGGSPTVPFWSLVDQSGGPDACWPWTGRRDPAGYGRGAFGWTQNAHRNAYLLTNPDFDRSLDVCHHCDNPPCCNPKHLFAGTHQENLLDAGRKGRLGKARGERHGNSKLTQLQRDAIRAKAASGQSQRSIAREFGITQPNVSYIVNGITWSKRPETLADSESVA